jgi:hypothetical protein
MNTKKEEEVKKRENVKIRNKETRKWGIKTKELTEN